MWKKFRWCATVISILGFAFCAYLVQELRSLKRKNKQYNRFFANLEKGHAEAGLRLGLAEVPAALQNVPFAEDEGIVVDTIRVNIRGVQAPYNASIIEYGNGYLLFFRYDVIDSRAAGPYCSYIGCAHLNQDFQQTEKEFFQIDTGSKTSEDPRVVKVGDAIYLIFNDVQLCGVFCRTMRIGRLNLEELKLEYITNLDMQIKRIEKNWVPFEYIEDGTPFVYLEYYLTPHKILKLPNPSLCEIVHLSSPSNVTYQKLDWPPIWGPLRGGAAARKVDDCYLSFFHSFFTDFNGIVWYVMGGYTFEGKPPFRINALSSHPILFKNIYDTPPINTAAAYKRVIFPGSFLTATRHGKEVICLVCGENDSAIKVVVFDKIALLKSLKKV